MEHFKNPITLKSNIKWISNLTTNKLEKIFIKEKIFYNPKIRQKNINNLNIKYLKIKDNNTVFFCKLVGEKFLSQELKSFEINKKVNTSKIAPHAYDYKKIFFNKKKNFLFIYEFIPEKKFLINKKNLKKIFLRLKLLHKLLKNKIRDNKLVKDSISRERKIFRNFNLIIKKNFIEKDDLLKCYKFFLKSKQLVHGDLHMKNVIYNDNFYFIDFEETSRTFLNPNIDYLNIMLKLILTKETKKINFVKFFYKKKIFNNFSLYILMKFIIFRNLSILKFYKNTKEKKSEEKKFYKYLLFLNNIQLELID